MAVEEAAVVAAVIDMIMIDRYMILNRESNLRILSTYVRLERWRNVKKPIKRKF